MFQYYTVTQGLIYGTVYGGFEPGTAISVVYSWVLAMNHKFCLLFESEMRPVPRWCPRWCLV